MKKAKKIIALLLTLAFVATMISCGKNQEQEHIHKIGVLVYDLKDEQVQHSGNIWKATLQGTFLMWISSILPR